MGKIALIAVLVAAPALAGQLDDARTLIDAGRYDDARPILERELSNGATKARSLLLLTELCNRTEDYASGVRYGEQATELLPDSSEAHLAYAQALRIKMTKVSKVKAMFSLGTYKKEVQRAIELDGSNAEAREEEIQFLLNAPGFAGGDKDKARQRIQEMKTVDWRRATRLDAQVEMQHGDVDRAIGMYDELLQRNPDDTGSRQELAYWLQQKERWQEADRQFEILTGAEDQPIALGALYQRGRTRVLGTFDQEQAIVFLTRYVEQIPDEPQGLPGSGAAYWRMGMAYEQLDRIDDARRSYSRAVEFDDKLDEARKALKHLD